MNGYVHSVESFGSVDGPGIRYVIFLSGCHMRCAYCHNPDTWKVGGGTLRSTDELLKEALKYRPYWGKDGGITVSGGEALLQIDFVTELFTKAKEKGVNTCLDTSAGPFRDEKDYLKKFKKLMDVTDVVLLDIKHIDPALHKNLTGFTNTNILACARYLSDIGKPVWIRHVLVPKFTDDDFYLKKLREFLDTLKNIERVEVLPYHTLGVYKWEELGLKYRLKGIDPPTKDRVDNARKILGAVKS